jgi:predicted Zn-dependent protease
VKGEVSSRVVSFCLFALIGSALQGCESVALAPVGSTPGKLVLEPDERRLWLRAEEEQRRLDASGLLYQDQRLDEYLNRVLGKLVSPGVKAQGISASVRVIKNPTLNAFALPAGTIYVHTGILARIENEAQLATLLGHELTHATHRHAVKGFRDLQNKAAAAATISVIGIPFGLIGALASALGQLGVVASVYGYSQENEAEADKEGLALMVNAGYDPRESPKLFMHIKEWLDDAKVKEPFFFGTHPRLQERVESYQQLLSGPFKDVEAHPGRTVGTNEYLLVIQSMILDNAVLDLQAGRFLATRKGLQKFITLSPSDARPHYYLGESYRRENDAKERDQAIPAYEKAIVLNQKYADPHRGLGTLYYQTGKKGEARTAFERYLELAPSAADRAYIENYLKELKEGGGGS